jgi:taurine---2-oxoglutarate transaminase
VSSDTAAATRAETIEARARQHLLHPWSKQSDANPVAIAGGSGSYFWDYAGTRYLDFGSQLVNLNLGHQHPKIIEAIHEQADRLAYISPAYGEDKRSELAALVAELTPGDLCMSLFTTGGAAANENAIRLARAYTGRQKIISRYTSYHGATYGAVSLSSGRRRWKNEPGIPGVVRMLDPYTYRCPAGHPDPCPVCSGGPHLRDIIEMEGPETIAAVIMEPITGTAGMIFPPDGYLQSIREVCDEYGILLILDEVMVGFGRTGEWFASNHWDVVPDIMTLAKGINSGYVPLGAMVVNERLRSWLWDNTFYGGLTYAAHPLACAAGVGAITAMKEEGTVANAARVGEIVAEATADMARRHPSIGEVRGLGAFFALELVANRETKQPLGAADPAVMGRIRKAALERGLFLNNTESILRIMPPLNIAEDDLRKGLEIVDGLLSIGDDVCS